jgi:hypothetical protein
VTTRICVLHVGTHKTGTTSFQALLAQNRSYFRENGIYYPLAGRTHPAAGRLFSHWLSRGWVHYSFGHHKLAWEVSGRRRDRWSRGNSLTQLAAELERVKPKTVLLSSEIFECLYGQQEALHRVREMLESVGFTARVVMTLRPPADYLQSLYVEMATWHGFTGELESFVAAALADGGVAFREWEFCFDYSRLVSVFAGVFGGANVRAVQYDAADSVSPLVRTSAALLGVRVPTIPHGERLNARATDWRRPTVPIRRPPPLPRPGHHESHPLQEVLSISQRGALDAAFNAMFENVVSRYGD